MLQSSPNRTSPASLFRMDIACCGPRQKDEGAGSNAEAIRGLSELLKEELENIAHPPDGGSRGDVYVGEDGAVNQQFVLDAPRSHYVIASTDYRFIEGTDSRDVFVKNISDAVRTCTGSLEKGASQSSLNLTKIVTLLLSQAGLALVDRACTGPILALKGGDRRTTYELTQVSESMLEIDIHFSANKFDAYADANHEDAEPRKCSEASSINRGCSILLKFDDSEVSGVAATVKAVWEDIAVLDLEGKPVRLEDRRIATQGGLSWWVAPSAVLGSIGGVLLVLLI
eukprot:TRINITY_DN36442_c0_g1_i1.p1 TRINITY_DN36442_c0_g1~~TRINITY_DN36442_c0_g1_i1.p1  ORF type:complete len:284 (+),score=42.86 TRINITY_DN36442_c0_g1_i1:42-893(+)